MSADQRSPDHDLKKLEAQLGTLRPADCRLSRDQLMFLAGQQAVVAVRPGPAAWRHPAWLVAAVALLCAAVSWLPSVRPTRTQIVERVVFRDRAPDVSQPQAALPSAADAALDSAWKLAAAEKPALGPNNYVSIRNAALERGLDALPHVSVGGHFSSEERSHHRWREMISQHRGAL